MKRNKIKYNLKYPITGNLGDNEPKRGFNAGVRISADFVRMFSHSLRTTWSLKINLISRVN